MNYEILVGDKNANGSLQNALNNARLPSVFIVQQAEKWLYERLRVREMFATTNGTMTASATSVPLPDRYRGWRDFRFSGTRAGRVVLRMPEVVRESYSWDANGDRTRGQPGIGYADATEIVFNCMADESYTYSFFHYAGLAPLVSGTGGTNFLTDRGGRALQLTCMAFGYEWMKQESDKQYFLQLAQLEVDTMNQNSDMEMGGLEEFVSVG